MSTLFVRGSEFTYDEAKPELIISTAHALLKRRLRPGAAVLTSPSGVRDFLCVHLGPRDYELFGLIYLDGRNRLIAMEELFRGTLNTASVYPREVVKAALKHNAAAVIFYHNHPSGHDEPSHSDELLTRRLREGLSLVEIQLLDHWIVAGDVIVSFRERGLL